MTGRIISGDVRTSAGRSAASSTWASARNCGYAEHIDAILVADAVFVRIGVGR